MKKTTFKKYDHHSIEKRWQSAWQRTRIYEADLSGAKHPFYNLMMFRYPSAEGLHVGNLFAFVGADIQGRFMSMNGFDVFEPIGFDAFGIHSENFAIKRGIHPKVLTAWNAEHFRETQLKPIGNRFDWSHEVNTTDPAYYKWTQWIFLQLFKAGLAVRKKASVNWCPSCKTVLDEEQVINGLCERCDSPVKQREFVQWFFQIGNYAQQLLENLDYLDCSEIVKTAQRHWIGRSEGLRFQLPVEGKPDAKLQVFTTRPDTIFGTTYVVLAPEHPLVDELTSDEYKSEVETYREFVRYRSELDRISGGLGKSGKFIGAYAINPVNQERIPIWIADYVLATYGTGAIMAVPAHDEQDFDFAKLFRIPIRQVVVPDKSNKGIIFTNQQDFMDGEINKAYTGPGILINSGEFSGLLSDAATNNIIEWFEFKSIGERSTSYRLRDWLISRQGYWGAPIPIIYCDVCGTVPVPEYQLPVTLPDVEDWKPAGTVSSPLASVPSFVETKCPNCGGSAHRETNVLDNFLDSAWSFLRYPSTEFNDRPFEKELTAKWLPVDMYIGGAEQAGVHLLASRFITMALHDLGHLPFEEPFSRFRAHGLITKDGAKMSKSHGNVVNPDEYIEKYGADTLRMYLMFLGPYDRAGDFNDQGIGGIWRFLVRVWDLIEKHTTDLNKDTLPLEYRRLLHETIHKVTEDIRSLKYNTAIAALMEYLNAIQSKKILYAEEVEGLLLLLAPFAPHIAEELWEHIGKAYSIHQQAWPKADPNLLIRNTVVIAVQINGRARGTIEIPSDAEKEEALEVARSVEAINRHLKDKIIHRVIYIPGKILNIVS